MSERFLLNIFSKFNLNKSFFNLCFELKILRGKQKFMNFWIFLILLIFITIIEIIKLIKISDNDRESLLKYGSLGYYAGGKECRFMLDLIVLSYCFYTIMLFIHYILGTNQWLFNANNIY